MIKSALGKLESVKLREIWGDEAADFTPWLAEHIRELGEALGMDLEMEGREQAVGPFSADIVCMDTATDRVVVIENQLERTDHRHLGQLMTYAPGFQANTVVWIAERFTDEHRAALDWLNEITGEDYRFFGLEIEAWRIGESLPAPKFNLVCKPNEWSKSVRQTKSNATQSETQQLRIRYWTAFKTYMESANSPLRCQNPGPNGYLRIPIGKSGIHMAAVISTWSRQLEEWATEIRAEIIIQTPNPLVRFAALEAQKDEIESEYGESLIWHAPAETAQRRIYSALPVESFDEPQWPQQHAWLKEKLECLERVLRSRVARLE